MAHSTTAISQLAKLLLGVSAVTLAACGGGGGGGGTGFIPSPPSPPPPTAADKVKIFEDPDPGEYVSVGAWTNLGASHEYTENSRITTVVSADSDQPTIRYTTGGYYEVQFPGEAYSRLVQHRGNTTDPNATFFELESGANRNVSISRARDSGFRYSEMARWQRPDLDFGYTTDFGVIAFGTPTAAGAVPVTGTASYNGLVAGVTDVTEFDGLLGYNYLIPAEGTVTLNFDFANGSLGGEMALALHGFADPVEVGTFAFSQTVFSPGSTTYSGVFDTSLAGFNFFNGRFTGPNAEETIGSWAVPFTFDGQNHQAIGAWIARRP